MHKAKTIYSVESERLRLWLAEKRATADLSIRTLAERLNWPSSIVGKIFTGDRRLDVLEYVQICNALHADVHEGLDLFSKMGEKSSRKSQASKSSRT